MNKILLAVLALLLSTVTLAAVVKYANIAYTGTAHDALRREIRVLYMDDGTVRWEEVK